MSPGTPARQGICRAPLWQLRMSPELPLRLVWSPRLVGLSASSFQMSVYHIKRNAFRQEALGTSQPPGCEKVTRPWPIPL